MNSSMPRAVVASSFAPPRTGGAELQALALAKLLGELSGSSIRLLTGRWELRWARSEEISGVKVERLMTPGMMIWRLPFIGHIVKPFFLVGLFIELIRSRKYYEWVLVAKGFDVAAAAKLASCFTRKPLVLRTTSSGNFREHDELKKEFPVSWRFLWRLARSSDAFLSQNELATAELKALGVPGERIFPVAPALDLQRFRPPSQEDKAVARKELGLDQTPVLLWVGSERPVKGLDVLLEACGKIGSPDAFLLLGGKTASKPAIVGGFKILCPGQRPDVEIYYRAADVFVLPSLCEGRSNALAEALASGLPCIVTDIPANKLEIAAGAVEAVRVGDSVALASTIKGLLDDSDKRMQLSRLARNFAEDNYSNLSLANMLRNVLSYVQGEKGK